MIALLGVAALAVAVYVSGRILGLTATLFAYAQGPEVSPGDQPSAGPAGSS